MRLVTEIEREYEEFEKRRSEYEWWMEGETTASQRVAAVRIGATYSLRNWVTANGEDSRDDCYRSYLRLVDAWFSYEALLMLAEEIHFTARSAPKPEKLLKSAISNHEMRDIVREFYADLREIMNKTKRKQSFQGYVDTLINYDGTSKSQKQYLSQLAEEIRKGVLQNENYSAILAFVYAIRNAYAHNGETARSGTGQYKSKLIILTASFSFMLKFILHTACIMYDELITTIS